jgi:hypothetical protein
VQDQYTLDIGQAVKLIHEAEELLPRLPADERDHTRDYINSALSVVTYYLRIRNPVVPEAHALAVAGLQTHIQSIKEPQHELASTLSP